MNDVFPIEHRGFFSNVMLVVRGVEFLRETSSPGHPVIFSDNDAGVLDHLSTLLR